MRNDVKIGERDTQLENRDVFIARISVFTRHDAKLGLQSTVKPLANHSFGCQFLIESLLRPGEGSVGMLLVWQDRFDVTLESLITGVDQHRPVCFFFFVAFVLILHLIVFLQYRSQLQGEHYPTFKRDTSSILLRHNVKSWTAPLSPGMQWTTLPLRSCMHCDFRPYILCLPL